MVFFSMRRGVILNIGDVRNVDATLEIGSLSETVTVDATPPPCDRPRAPTITPSETDRLALARRPGHAQTHGRVCERRPDRGRRQCVPHGASRRRQTPAVSRRARAGSGIGAAAALPSQR
jgi:hypothetical protein